MSLNKHYFALLLDGFGTRFLAALGLHLSLCSHQQKASQQLKEEKTVFAFQNMREAKVTGSTIWIGEN